MTTRRTKVLLSLLAVATLGFSMVNAYTFFVENRNPFGALNLTKLIIKASPEEQTGMELSNFKLQINTADGQLNVHKICDENGENCRDVDVLYTWTQGNQWPQWNTWAHVVTWYVSWNDIVFGLSDDSIITLANVISQISSTWPQWDTWAQWDTWVSIVSWYINENDIVFELSNNSTITLAGIIQAITWPQGNTWANWTWIDHISTWYDEENWITTVNIYYTTNTEYPAVSFQIHDWTDWVWGNLDPDDFDWIYALFRLNDVNHSGYVAAPGENNPGLVWKTDDNGNPSWLPDATWNGITYTQWTAIAINGDTISVLPNNATQSGYVAAPGVGNSGKVWKTSADGTPSWQDDATGGYELPVANETALWGIKVGYQDDNENRYYGVHLSDGNAFVNVPWEASEWTEIYGENKHWCTYNCWDWQKSISLEWNCPEAADIDYCHGQETHYHGESCTDEETDETCINIALEIRTKETELGDTWFTIFDYNDWGCRVSCFENEPSWGWIPVTHYLSGKVCRYITPDILEEITNLTQWLKFSFEAADIASEWEIRCVFNDETWDGWWGITIADNPTLNWYCVYVDNDTIRCDEEWWETIINGGDSFRQTWNISTFDFQWQTTQRTVLKPTLNSSQYSWIYFTNNFYHNSWFQFYTNQDGTNRAASRIIFDAKGIRINDWRRSFTWAWLSVGWTIVAWNSSTDNYIYMYATGHYNDLSTKHFEIMWSKELAIWANSWAYLYFNSDNTSINRSVWVNTTSPKATLDVAGPIRISNNCAGSVNTSQVFYCDSTHYTNNQWTIMFYENHFYWCMRSGDVYGRYDLAGGGFYTNQITTNCWYQPFLNDEAITEYAFTEISN